MDNSARLLIPSLRWLMGILMDLCYENPNSASSGFVAKGLELWGPLIPSFAHQRHGGGPVQLTTVRTLPPNPLMSLKLGLIRSLNITSFLWGKNAVGIHQMVPTSFIPLFFFFTDHFRNVAYIRTFLFFFPCLQVSRKCLILMENSLPLLPTLKHRWIPAVVFDKYVPERSSI